MDERTSISPTALTMLGRPRESSPGGAGAGSRRCTATGWTGRVLVANPIEALIASASGTMPTGSVPPRSAASPPTTRHAAHHPRRPRARAGRLRGRRRTSRPPCHVARGPRAWGSTTGTWQSWRCGSAAGPTPTRRASGLRASSPQADQLRVWLCAKGLRALAELAALARARRDAEAARRLARQARRCSPSPAAPPTASAITPNAGGWLALAEAEDDRAQGVARRTRGPAASTWDGWNARCWRPTAAGARPRRSYHGRTPHRRCPPARWAHAVATRVGAEPLRARARTARPTSAARRRPPGRAHRPPTWSRWADTLGSRARSRRPRSRRSRRHQPRHRQGPVHQREDGKRPCLQHPAEARRHQSTRGRRGRPPPIRPVPHP